jgi:hypothetical protein
VVGEQAHEHIDPAGGALGIGAGADPRGQGQGLLQFGDVDAALLEHRPLGQVELVHRHVGQALGDLAAKTRQERGPYAPGALAQAQVEAGGLHLVAIERRQGGDGAGMNQAVDGLGRQDAGRGS